MEFMLTKKENPVLETYAKTDVELARHFAKRMHDEFGNFVRAVVIFGSSARKEARTESDVDILVVVDDVSIALSPELIQTYRVLVEKIIADVSTRLHITSLRFSSFWEYVRAGDPVAINVLRDGVALIDTGFFDPLQVLLKQGRIRPSKESIWSYFFRAPITLHNSKWHVLQATLDLYWASIDAAHAALMSVGEVPPTPEHVADLIELKLVKTGLTDKKYSGIMRNLYKLSKMILYREVKEIEGSEYAKYQKDATDFVDAMRAIVEKQK